MAGSTGGGAKSVVRRRVVYVGRVQGVGFRYTTLEISRGFDVSGFVRNLPDGSVELEAQGAAEGVDGFLDSVMLRFARNIREARRTDQQPAAGDAAFEIRC